MTLPDIEWEDTYPTEASLAAATKFWTNPSASFHVRMEQGRAWIREQLKQAAENCCASVYDVDGQLGFSTGGWSGAEDLVGLIERSPALAYHMLSWKRGGHYVFEVNP